MSRVVECLPRATLRVQLNRHYRFDDARACVPYFARLGISHLFVSPIQRARAGSLHGYDVVDHAQLNPELGDEDALRRLVATLREHGMGLIVDIVPNHMAVAGADNPRWLDVLEWGRESRNAQFFDIDWDRAEPTLAGKVLLPFLGEPYGVALMQEQLSLRFDADDGGFFVAYAEHRCPLAPAEYPALLESDWAQRFSELLRTRGRRARQATFASARADLALAAREDPALRAAIDARLEHLSIRQDPTRKRLHRLMELQHWRLAWWRTAADEINWRRFFDVTTLAALRVQDRAVFETVHALTFRLYAEGLIDGLRVDHVDGLADPRGYCRLLRARLRRLAASRPDSAPRGPAYLVVEKILGANERLAADWQVDGTTGYSFMNEVAALLHDPAGQGALTRTWIAHRGEDFEVEERRARRRIVQELFAADTEACAHALHAVARNRLETRDWTQAAMRRVLTELLVNFPVYRSYADARGRNEQDAQLMREVIAAAAQTCRPGELPLLHRVDAWLGGEPAKNVSDARERALRLRALARFQQLTSPVAAKAVEDTAHYRHARLLSRNEVGADPRCFALPAQAFHALCADRRQRYPSALLATATHDHKRGEDVRMRLATLSELAEEWGERVSGWHILNAGLRFSGRTEAAPDDIDEYILYQTLVGTWPAWLDVHDRASMSLYVQRLREWQRKALREARRHSGWDEPTAEYETRCGEFLDALLDPTRSAEFLDSLTRFVERIAPAAAIKSLSQTLLRMTCPGIPDLYQGCEFWDLSLVDPDNRRLVEYPARIAALQGEVPGAELLRKWTDGAVKQRLIARTLALRAQQPELFARGRYRPLRLRGPAATRFIAFARSIGRKSVVVIATLHPLGLMQPGEALRLSPQALTDSEFELPRLAAHAVWVDALEGRVMSQPMLTCPLATLLDPWPVALLYTRAG